VVNKDYIRLTTMENMAMDQFARQEVLGLNLGGWIIDGPGYAKIGCMRTDALRRVRAVQG
jgi:hypothetical protein